jgi:antitoxin ParD1/3/4
MKAYRTHLVVEDPDRVVVSNVPFQRGQHVEVLFLAHDDLRLAQMEDVRALFKETQSLSQVQALTEEDIAAEIAAYRCGQ